MGKNIPEKQNPDVLVLKVRQRELLKKVKKMDSHVYGPSTANKDRPRPRATISDLYHQALRDQERLYRDHRVMHHELGGELHRLIRDLPGALKSGLASRAAKKRHELESKEIEKERRNVLDITREFFRDPKNIVARDGYRKVNLKDAAIHANHEMKKRWAKEHDRPPSEWKDRTGTYCRWIRAENRREPFKTDQSRQ